MQCRRWIVWDAVQAVDKVHRLHKYTGGKKARIAVYDFKTILDASHSTRPRAQACCLMIVFDNRQWAWLVLVNNACDRLHFGKSESTPFVQQRSAEAGYEMDTDSGCRSLMFDAVEAGGLYVPQVRQRLVCGKKQLGISMRTNCAPFLANLYAYELAFQTSLIHGAPSSHTWVPA